MIDFKQTSRPLDDPTQRDDSLGEISLGSIVSNLVFADPLSALRPRSEAAGGQAARGQPGCLVALGPRLTVGDIRVGCPDARGVPVEAVHAIKPGTYAIYRAADQMMVHFADDPELADKQRSRLASLAGLRAKLSLLISELADVTYYRGQIANAFQLALDDSIKAAETVMSEAVANAQKERACAGRLQYMFYGVMTGMAFLAAFGLGYRYLPFADISSDVWLAVIGGTSGAIFSIAISIRSRTVALDLYRYANITDGVLRILVGIIGSAALVLLLSAGILPDLKINDSVISGGDTVWQTVVVVGFIAGFLERLLPNLLEQA